VGGGLVTDLPNGQQHMLRAIPCQRVPHLLLIFYLLKPAVAVSLPLVWLGRFPPHPHLPFWGVVEAQNRICKDSAINSKFKNDFNIYEDVDAAFRWLLGAPWFVAAGLTRLHTTTSTPCTMASTLGSAVIVTYCKAVKHAEIVIVNSRGGLVPLTTVPQCMSDWDAIRVGATPTVLAAAQAKWKAAAAAAAAAVVVVPNNNKLNVAELRAKLGEAGLATTGRKAELQARLKQHLQQPAAVSVSSGGAASARAPADTS
jgi:hypothetical protein